tara:strand:+ start:382 stop:798 length:417 start_codon:yes stop_codon:yes gene_type:complete
MKKLLFASALFLIGFTTAQAQYDYRNGRNDHYKQDNHRQVDKNTAQIEYLQHEARQRIDAGIHRRQLSPRDADRLMADYRRIEGLQRKFSNRGRLSNKETRLLKDQLSRLIVTTRRMSEPQRNHRADDRYRGNNRNYN